MTKIVVFDVMVLESFLFQDGHICHFPLKKREKVLCIAGNVLLLTQILCDHEN